MITYLPNSQPLDPDLTTWAGITPGTGVGTALAINVGTTGAFVVKEGALGTPSSGTGTNLTGIPQSGVTNLTGDLALKAPLASPTFTGTVTLPASTILTTPKIITSLTDTNANTLLGVTATGSAVNYINLANSATSTLGGTISSAGTGTNLDINLAPKGSGVVSSSGPLMVNGGVQASNRAAIFNGGNGVIVQNTTADDSGFLLYAGGGDSSIRSTFSVTGSYKPMTFYTNGSERMRMSVAGGLSVGTTTDAGVGNILVNGSVKTAKIVAPSDSTTAVQVTKADGTTAVGTWDTTNSRLGLGVTPTVTLDVAGAFKTTGEIQTTATGQIFHAATGSGTGAKYAQFSNAGGRFYLGIENSTGSGLWTGSTNYASSMGSANATDLQFATNNTVRLTIASGGNTTFSGGGCYYPTSAIRRRRNQSYNWRYGLYLHGCSASIDLG